MKFAIALVLLLATFQVKADDEWWISPGALTWHDSNRMGEGSYPIRGINQGVIGRYRADDGSEVIAGWYRNSFNFSSILGLYRPAWGWCESFGNETWRVNCTPYFGFVTGYRKKILDYGPGILEPRPLVSLFSFSVEYEKRHGVVIELTPKKANWPMSVSFLYMYRMD